MMGEKWLFATEEPHGFFHWSGSYYSVLHRIGEYPTPAGYNDHDYQKLATFLELPNGEGKNGHKLNADYDPADPTTWTGVYWDSGETKRVARISWYSKDLTGSLDLSDCSALKNLNCLHNQLTSLDLKDCPALETLSCSFNELTSLDLSGCLALTKLYCDNNQLTVLDLRDCSGLEIFYCHFNGLTSLDLSGCSDLEILYCSSNQLTNLNLGGCSALRDLDCNNNQLTGSLDLSGCPDLQELRCNSNQLESLDLTGCEKLQILWCDNNQLTFSDLPVSLPVTGGTYRYFPQNPLPISAGGQIFAGEKIDLSAEAKIDGVNTVFTWYNEDGEEITPTTATNGVFIFDRYFAEQIIYCRMTNAKFPDLTLETTKVRIVEPEPHRITFIKPTAANDATNPVNINNGSLVIATISGDASTVTSVTIKVDEGQEQTVTLSGNTIYYLLPADLSTGGHTIIIKLTNTAGQIIEEAVTFHWNSYRRGFGFGRFDFGDVPTEE